MNLTNKNLDRIYTALNDSLNCFCSVSVESDTLFLDLNPSGKEQNPVLVVDFVSGSLPVKIRIFKNCPNLCLSYFPFIQEVVDKETD